MPTALEIYRESVSCLSPADQRQLAEVILEGLEQREAPAQPRVHMADFVKTLPPGPRSFKNWEQFGCDSRVR